MARFARATKPLALVAVAAFVAVLSLHQVAYAGYNIGVGKADITGPAAEVGMMGWVDPMQKTAGILDRLNARAFIVEEQTPAKNRVVIVHTDLHSVSQLVHQEVIRQLRAKYGGLYTEQNVLLHASHSHSTPGGHHGYFMYDIMVLGYVSDTFDAVVNGIMRAIDRAHMSVRPGKVRYGKTSIDNGGVNRSPRAYEANPAAEKLRYASNRDTDLRMLQFVDDSTGRLRGILAFFPTHTTSLKVQNRLISGDHKGYAEFLLEQELGDAIVALGMSNAGDVSPNLIDGGNGQFYGEGKDLIESAEMIGSRLAEAMRSVLRQPCQELNGPVGGKLSYVDFSNVVLQNVAYDPARPYAHRTCPAVLGQNMASGTEDGRGIDMFTEGNLKANPLFAIASAIISPTPDWVRQCHTSAKVPLLAVGVMNFPYAWMSENQPVQALRLGQFAIAATSFEVTTMAGRRIRDTLRSAFGNAVTDVELATVTNGWAQYMTTAEEYAMQHYEGGSTPFGPNQLAAYQQELARVARSLADPSVPLSVGPTPRQFDRSQFLTLDVGVVMDTTAVRWDWSWTWMCWLPSFQFGTLRWDAADSYRPGDTVSVGFNGAHPRNRFQDIGSFCDLERETSSGFVTVATDADWDIRYKWERMWLTESKSVCEWNIRPGRALSSPGRYRLRHRGFWKDGRNQYYYEGTSRVFTVRA